MAGCAALATPDKDLVLAVGDDTRDEFGVLAFAPGCCKLLPRMFGRSAFSCIALKVLLGDLAPAVRCVGACNTVCSRVDRSRSAVELQSRHERMSATCDRKFSPAGTGRYKASSKWRRLAKIGRAHV